MCFPISSYQNFHSGTVGQFHDVETLLWMGRHPSVEDVSCHFTWVLDLVFSRFSLVRLERAFGHLAHPPVIIDEGHDRHVLGLPCLVEGV